ncbi:MAG: HlyC/CorC family transporter [Alphaproteobacteria bacterium]|nr:HlyC/CorC family transporter [Alphaproteobacteria bacterium]
MLYSILAIIVLIALSGFFSGSETALTAASRPLMLEKEKQKNKKASIVNRLYQDSESLIGSILLGNNLVNILATAISTSLFINLFGERGVAYATILMTFLVLVFAEILPKTYAIRNPNQAALAVSPIMSILVAVLSPVIKLLQYIVNFTLMLFGAHDNGKQAFATGIDELRGAIQMHMDDEEIVEEKHMLKSVLDLAEVDVEEVMTHRKNVRAIDLDDSIKTIIDTVMDCPFTRVPVWQSEPDNIIGMLHVKDLAKLAVHGVSKVKKKDIQKIMHKPWFVLETTSLLTQLQAFRSRHEHFALVVDEYGALQGIITLEDVLEEIVGDISDEHDAEESESNGVSPQGDDSYLVDGEVTIRDLNRQFDWDLPDDNAATIAGLLLYETESIPEVGQNFTFHGFGFMIARRKKNQITSVRITPLNQKSEHEDKEKEKIEEVEV